MTNYHNHESELNALNKKFFHVFTAGQYPQGTVTVEDLQQVADGYDPSVYEAPVWIGHPGSDVPEEPKAYGWVESLMVSGDKLYASFSHLDDDLIGMVNSKKYRRCSVELGKLNYEPLKDKLYLIAIALTNRPAVAGLIAAAVASLFSVTLAEHGYEGSSILVTLTFLTIFITVVFQGFTAAPLARILGVFQQGRNGLIILGGNTFCIELAKVLMRNEIPVTILDSNTLNCGIARQEGINSECGDVLDDEFWDDIDKSQMNYFLAATSNNELNSLAVQKASEYIKKENLYQIRNSYAQQTQEFSLKKAAGNQHYDMPLDILGLSSDIIHGHANIKVLPKDSIGNSKVILGIDKKGYLIFRTDPEDLAYSEKVVVLESIL